MHFLFIFCFLLQIVLSITLTIVFLCYKGHRPILLWGCTPLATYSAINYINNCFYSMRVTGHNGLCTLPELYMCLKYYGMCKYVS